MFLTFAKYLVRCRSIHLTLDNQEVFNDIDTDQTVIVELLEYIENANLSEAVILHFQEMASLNEAKKAEVVSVEELSNADVANLPYGNFSLSHFEQ